MISNTPNITQCMRNFTFNNKDKNCHKLCSGLADVLVYNHPTANIRNIVKLYIGTMGSGIVCFYILNRVPLLCFGSS